MIRMKDILNYKISIRIVIAVVLFLALVLIFPTSSFIQKKIQCRSAIDQYESGLHVISELDTKARNEWNSFPKYTGGFGEDARDPNGGGGRIYSNFDEYFAENYGFESNSELRIAQLLIVQNSKCFSPREVAEAQDYLDKVK